MAAAKRTAAYWRARAQRAEKALAALRDGANAYFNTEVNGEVPDLPQPRKRKQHSDTKQAIDHFHGKFVEAYQRRPTWEGKTVRMVDDLVKVAGLDEVVSRINVMFEGHLGWLKPPYTVETLRQHFDKFIVVAEFDPRAEWVKVRKLVNRFGRGGFDKAAKVLQHGHPKTLSIVMGWGWVNLCNTSAQYAEKEFLQRWKAARMVTERDSA